MIAKLGWSSIIILMELPRHFDRSFPNKLQTHLKSVARSSGFLFDNCRNGFPEEPNCSRNDFWLYEWHGWLADWLTAPEILSFPFWGRQICINWYPPAVWELQMEMEMHAPMQLPHTRLWAPCAPKSVWGNRPIPAASCFRSGNMK